MPTDRFSFCDMQVVVLIGGLGIRLKPVVPDRPKTMADVHGKPFFYYQLLLLRWYGFKRFLFCTGFGEGEITRFFKDGSEFGVNIQYSSEGEKLLGTGGA